MIYKFNKIDILVILLLSFISYIFIYYFSASTSPIYDNANYDQNTFFIVGREWASGGLPYVSAWDSKGPLIFFVNMLGYKLTYNIVGVFYIEIINLILSLLVSYYMLRRYFKPVRSFFYVIVFLCSYAIVFSQGNQVGEYTLALSVIALLLAYRWSREWNDGKVLHPYSYSFLYGIFIAACLLSRLTNAMPVMIICLLIFIILFYNGQWKNLLFNVLAFLLGFATIFLPVTIYFISKGAFSDMWYATFSYNMEYMLSSSSSQTMNAMSHSFVYFILYFFCIISLLIYCMAMFIYNPNDKKFDIFWCIVSGLTIVWLIKSYANANYAITYLPLILIPLIDSKLYQKFKIYRITSLSIVFVVIVGFINYIRIFPTQIVRKTKKLNAEISLLDKIPRNSNFVAYNCNAYVYTATGLRPCYPYFVFQDWAIENGHSLRKLVVDRYASLDAEWILIEDMESSNIKNILSQHYKIVSGNDVFNVKLLKLK